MRQKKKNVAVTAGGEDHRVTGMGADFTGDEIADNNPFGMALHHNNVQQLLARKHLHPTERDLAGQSLVGTQEQLLASLAPGVKGAGNLGASEGSICE